MLSGGSECHSGSSGSSNALHDDQWPVRPQLTDIFLGDMLLSGSGCPQGRLSLQQDVCN